MAHQIRFNPNSFLVTFLLFLTSVSHGQVCSAPKDWFLNPFNKNSPYHRPIGEDAVYASSTAASTLAIKNFGSISVAVEGHRFGMPTFVTGDDQLQKVTLLEDKDEENFYIKAPPETRNFGSVDGVGDGNMTIYDPETFVAHQFRTWRWSTGSPVADMHYAYNIRGLGYQASPTSPKPGSSASHVASLFGIIRGKELETPGYKIEHITQLSLNGKADQPGPMQLNKNEVWPSSGHDSFCAEPKNCVGPIPYGSLLAIPRKIDLTKLGLSDRGYRLALAWQQYGIYVIDGSTGPNIRADQFVKNPAALTKEIREKIWKYVRVVKNNKKDQLASGGGKPIAPNCAVDAR